MLDYARGTVGDSASIAVTGPATEDHVEPRLDEERHQIFEIDIPELGIFVSASTREELMDELLDHLEFAWVEYAEADDRELSQDALDLKRALLELVGTIPPAQ